MGFNPPVPQQDSDWEIRAAVLLSLLLQLLLIFLGPTRKRPATPLPRFAVWSCYLLADWVADLALGLLLNNMGDIATAAASSGGSSSSDDNGSPIVFAFWTPFLLLHLGGPDTVTAYALEDNELWPRHLVGLLFELFSAAVVFFCSLRDNPLVHATVLVFVAGVVKYGERTYSLYRGSVDCVRDSCMDSTPPDPAGRWVSSAGEEMMSLEARAYDLFCTFRRVFVDLPLSFSDLRPSQAFFLDRGGDLDLGEASEVIELELDFVYEHLYTKAPVAYTPIGWVLRGVCSACLVSALVIFFLHHKRRPGQGAAAVAGDGIARIDVGVTYALLLGGLALDAVAMAMLLFSTRVAVFLQRSPRLAWLAQLTRRPAAKRWRSRRRWGSTGTPRFNLISHCLDRPGHYPNNKGARWWMWIKVAGDFIRGLIRPLVSKQPQDSEEEDEPPLLRFVFNALKEAAMEVKQADKDEGTSRFETKEKDGSSLFHKIREVCNRRGERTINEYERRMKETTNREDHLDAIRDSVERSEFDESLLLWHVATDLLCRVNERPEGGAPLGPRDRDTTAWRRSVAETLSEYMLHLLVEHPEMLDATAGIGLLRYRDTCEEARRFFGSSAEAAWIDGDGDDARRTLLRVGTAEKPAAVKGDRSKSVLFDAVILAKALLEVDDEELRWALVAGVWGEMLAYAAAKCPGTTHARQLGRGGALLTRVWLLMAHMGLRDMYSVDEEGDSTAKRIVVDE